MDSKDYMEEQQKKFEDYETIYGKETNEVFRELVRQLILTGTVFLSISVFAFNIKGLLKHLSFLDKHLLAFSWILIGLSIVFGIGQFIIDYYYSSKVHKAMGDITEIIYLRKVAKEDLGDAIHERQKNIPRESSTVFVWLQLISLSLGFILIIFVMIKALFSI